MLDRPGRPASSRIGVADAGAQVRGEQLAKLEAERGESFWVYGAES
jgi:hypothetical protein